MYLIHVMIAGTYGGHLVLNLKQLSGDWKLNHRLFYMVGCIYVDMFVVFEMDWVLVRFFINTLI